jgi:ABC-type transporter Mla maintaining outer membrane lipid asymmetry permease subunit MlaE
MHVQFQSSHFSWEYVVVLSVLVTASVLMITYFQGVSSYDTYGSELFSGKTVSCHNLKRAKYVPTRNKRILV